MNEPTRHDPSDEGLGQHLASQLPRYSAPVHLRATILAPPAAQLPRLPWLSPLVAAAATALVLVLVGAQYLPRTAAPDTTALLMRAVVSEHSRALMWGSRRAEIMPAALPQLAAESGVALTRVFMGDDRLSFIAAEPVYLDRTRGVALHYRDVEGHLVTYVALPERRLTVPERRRVQIGRWRPALLHDDTGFVSWVWRQGDLACFLVSDLVSDGELDRFKDYFVRVRTETEPKPAY
jgi:hypothetical protein